MSTKSTIDDIKARILNQIDSFKIRIFGQNNERLDLLVDSFNKLDANQQKMALSGGIVAIFAFIILSFAIYFTNISSLKNDLSESFEAIRQLESLSTEHTKEKRKFDKLLSNVKSKTRGIRSFKSHFESLSRKEGITLRSLNESAVKISPENPLSDEMNEVKVDLDVDNISLPKILKFAIAVEKDGKYMKVSNLKIRSRYGTKLYFDTKMSIKGYKVK
jgi:hypothetical protein